MKYAFYTFGCRANQYQTAQLESRISHIEYRISNFGEPADVYVINTCSVTEDAERKARQMIRRALKLAKKVIVTGCYARLQKERLQQLFPQIEILATSSLTPSPWKSAPRIRSFLMIQDGCDHFCSYCIVPYARGKVTSKPIKEVLSEAVSLVEGGAREIVLTGINLGTYQFGLGEAVQQLSKLDGLLRIRLSSIEPMYLTTQLIDQLAATPKACDHLHIPLQSGSDRILSMMSRNYTGKDFRKLVSYIRSRMPNCGITTDIIVGFPGEGEKEFLETVELINQVGFSRLHIFPYSQRPGTPAADFPDQVQSKIKRQRSRVLFDLNNQLMKNFAERYLGQEVKLLAEQKGAGLTANYIRCLFDDPVGSSGQLKSLKVRSVNSKGIMAGSERS